MREYFEAEMRLLHEAAQDFAQAHPEQARMLNLNELRDRDPYIERLLEGMAFLTAHVRQRIEESEAAVSQQLLAHVCPNQLTPYPSTTIIAFEPDVYRQASQELAAGLEMLSEPVGEHRVECRFRTIAPVTLQPLAVDSVSAEEKAGRSTVIRLGFRKEGSSRLEQLDLAGLPLFLHADQPLALALYQALTQGIRRARVLFPEAPRVHAADLGGQQAIQPMYLDPETTMLPNSGRGHPGFNLLQDYFCCREKYLFVDLRGLDGVEWPEGCRRFDVEIECEAMLPPEHKLVPENIRLHCVPAINLFDAESEPVEVDHRRTEYRLLPDVRYPEEVFVYSVNAVTGRDYSTGKVTDYKPLYGLRGRGKDERHYHAVRRDFGTGLPQTYLAVGGHRQFGRESLSCDITACNGHLPRKHLHENQINRPTSGIPSGVRFSNITRPSPFWQPPAEQDYPWRLNALLALNLGSFAEVGALRQMLELFDWTGLKENRRRAEGVTEVSARAVSRMMHGMLHRGLEVKVTLDEGNFLSAADAYLFGQVLHRFFTLSAAVNEYVETRVVCQPSYQEFVWAPRLGRNSPI